MFFRIAARRGQKKAAVAIAHKILVIAFHVIRDGEVYHELGDDLQDRLHPTRTIHRLTRRLENLGFDVKLSERVESTTAIPTPGSRKNEDVPAFVESEEFYVSM